jgi:hypothetical protein
VTFASSLGVTAGWRITLDIRALKADGTGCEPDGRIVFNGGAPSALAA